MRKFVLLFGCFAATPLAAGETKLAGEAIKTTLSGSLVAMDTPIGTTVSVRIGHDGLMTGEAGAALGAVLGASKDRGRWWVANDQICFKWFRWFDAEERCASISIDGNRLSWRKADGDTGTGTIVEPGKPVAKPSIVAEATKKPDAPVHKPVEKAESVKSEVASADLAAVSVATKAEAKHIAAVVKPVAEKKAIVASAVAEKPKALHETVVALKVPPPRPAVRPQNPDKVSVASVKPQFFTSAKVQTAKIAKVQMAEPRLPRRPFRVAGVEPTDVLNIRNGPSPDYLQVGSIPPNSGGITITGPCQNDWCPVKHRTLVGWVNRRYLTEETASNTTAGVVPNYWDPAQ